MDIFDLSLYKRIDYYMRYLRSGLESVVKQEKLDLDITQVDLVLELKSAPDTCWYYFVNHNGRCLFWLHESNVEHVLTNCKGVESLSHISGWIVVVSGSGSDSLTWFSSPGLAIQAQYWCVLGKVRTTLLTTSSHS